MNQTQNYQLNQWSLGDAIRMADFNADNAKLDAALAAEVSARQSAVSAEAAARQNAITELQSRVTALETKTTLQTLKTHTVWSQTNSVTLSFSGVGFARWKAVHVDMQLSGNDIWRFQLNSESAGNLQFSANGHYRFVFLPMWDGTLGVCGMVLGSGAPHLFGSGSVKFSNLSSMTIYPIAGANATFYLSAGSKLTVYGEA